MPVPRLSFPVFLALPCMMTVGGALAAQSPNRSALPATAPTQTTGTATAPLAGSSSGLSSTGSRAARVTCAGGQLEVHAENSSLNQILKSISRCTGMQITGGVAEQRVFGTYGPAAPATVLATLLDGTGSNMLLKETASDQPGELVLTPRTGGPTPPPLSSYADTEAETPKRDVPPQQQSGPPGTRLGLRTGMRPGGPGSSRSASGGNGPGGPGGPGGSGSGDPNQTPVPQANAGSPVTNLNAIPIGNNVNGSPNNQSPTASTYPTTNSVPLDSLPTPSTTPATNGIVDAPNPPPVGSDTAAVLNGAPQGTPGTTTFDPNATSQTSTPGATNTTVPAASPGSTDLTPEQVVQQLQQRLQQQQQQQQQDAPQDHSPQ